MKIQLTKYNVESQLFTEQSSDVRQIASPLVSLGIVMFARVRIWEDSSISILTSHPDFSVKYVKEKFYKFAFGGSSDIYHSGMFLVQDSNVETSVIKAVNDLSIQTGGFTHDMAIIEKFSTYADLYWFGTGPSIKNIANFYLNHLEKLKKFIAYFKMMGGELLLASNQLRLLYPSASTDKTILTSSDFNASILNSPFENNIIDQWSNWVLGKNYGLTRQESICASYLKKGFTRKQLAYHLKISPRTIEKHLDNLKKKTNSRSLIHLLSKLNSETV